MMNKFFWGLIAISLSLSACQNGKNSVNSDKSDGVVSVNGNLYHDNAKTNELLTLNNWELATYIDPEGQEISYSGFKRYSFAEKHISFNDNFPNDCNSCIAKADYDYKQQIINVKKNSSISCTEIACGNAAATLEDNAPNSPGNEFTLNLEENMGYKILKNNTLELQTSMGRYIFRIATDLKALNLKDLDNTAWEIIAYHDIKNNPVEKLTPLKKSLIISFNSTGYGYSPDCNNCGYTIKGFSTKNNTISWDKKADVIGTCTQMACLNQEQELPHNIVSNGMAYAVVDNYLYLTDDKYKLKLRPFKVK